jgi:ATP-dependent DNA helicase RecG
MSIGTPSLDTRRLQRVFELELARGCRNETVVGGLDRMLIQMHEDGLIAIGSAFREHVLRLPAGGYRALDEQGRQVWLQGAISALDGPSRPASAGLGPAAAAHRAAPAAPRRPAGLALDDPVTALPGVGKAVAARFERLGVRTAGDAAMFFPRRYNDFTDQRQISELSPSKEPQTVIGELFSIREMRYGRRAKGAEAVFRDRSGALRVVWFNMPYVARQLVEGGRYVIAGKVRAFRGRLQMENPEVEPFDESLPAGRMVPVYPATQGLSQRTIRTAVNAALDRLGPRLPDVVPGWLREREGLAPALDAMRTIHSPASQREAEAARQRLALAEFLAIQCAVLHRRAEWQRGARAPVLALGRTEAALLDGLPFRLTRSQRAALDDILRDLQGPPPMLRLLQGDVGSGKTVVAFAAMMAAVCSGHQAALMVPTEVLAEQHYRSITGLLGGGAGTVLDGVFRPPWLDRSVRVLLLTGSLTPAQKAQVRADAAHGGADIVIGTHALLEDDVQLPRLGLAVVDEQHRFGVMQRVAIRQKGNNPHLLVMTATPIPRTLALTVYGDLEVSTINEMPPGRRPIKTTWVHPYERDEAYRFVREHLDAGEQAFVICPLVEDSETLDVRSAEEEFERLRTGPFRNYRVELLHGRMAGRQKDEVMARFARGEADILVSTSVIEVGIDVPNATVIIIEGAERFGLSQLHQFRGRVGRSPKQSYCMLFSTEDEPGPDARERLEAMVETTDGFELAEVDLAMRGEGEAWGTLQSGANTMLRVARLTDRDLLVRARAMAASVLDRDPLLQLPEHRALAAAVRPFLERAAEAN